MNGDIMAENEVRKQRGLEIVNTLNIQKREWGGYVVPSQYGRGLYIVQYVGLQFSCECPDFTEKGNLGIKCKHIWAVEILTTKTIDNNGVSKMATKTKITYSQNWKAYNAAQCNELQIFMRLLAGLCQNVPDEQYKFGRPKVPIQDAIYASAMKVYSTKSIKRSLGALDDALLKGYITKKCSHTFISEFMQEEYLTQVLKDLIEISSLPLKGIEKYFAVDSTGFSTTRFGRYYSFKHQRDLRYKKWVKCHIMTGVKSNIITAVRITEERVNDSPQFIPLVKQTAKNFYIKEVSADKAYLSKDNLDYVYNLGGTAIIPFKSNSTGKKRGSKALRDNWYRWNNDRTGYMFDYHKRSNVESTFHMMKSKFGDHVRSRTEVAQRNEVLLKVLCHNICVVIHETFEGTIGT